MEGATSMSAQTRKVFSLLSFRDRSMFDTERNLNGAFAGNSCEITNSPDRFRSQGSFFEARSPLFSCLWSLPFFLRLDNACLSGLSRALSESHVTFSIVAIFSSHCRCTSSLSTAASSSMSLSC